MLREKTNDWSTDKKQTIMNMILDAAERDLNVNTLDTGLDVEDVKLSLELITIMKAELNEC